MTELIREYRGILVENIHHGRIAVVNERSELIYGVGDTEAMTFYRSASKPLQALPVIVHGLDKTYALNDQELAIMAGSHAGEPDHLQAILSILRKSGLSEEEMVMCPTYPGHRKTREEMLCGNVPPRKALHNCAGKHGTTMMVQRLLTGSAEGYWQPESAVQREVLSYIAQMSEWPAEEITLGIDGCGVPVFAVPLQNIAIAYMKLACPDKMTVPEVASAIERLDRAIHRSPLMMRGTGHVCTILNEDSNLIAKAGARGVYGLGLKRERLGISLKFDDGTEDYWAVAIAEILRQLNYANKETILKLEQLTPSALYSDSGTLVGEVRPVFQLV